MKKEYPIQLRELRKKIKAADTAIPQQRMVFRNQFSFSTLPFREQLDIWHYIWNTSEEYLPKIHSSFYLETLLKNKVNLLGSWAIIKQWQDSADTWMYCDSLSKIYTKILEHDPDSIYPTLLKWNSSPDLWKRRQSVVSHLYYARTKKQFLPYDKIILLIENLLRDGEYYVQKGVGWSLREVYNVYPDQAWLFMKKNNQHIHSIAFSAATEKLPVNLKKELLLLRKGNKTKPNAK